MSELPGLVLRHGDLGPPGLLAEWLEARDIPYEVHRMGSGPLPDLRERPWVASLGARPSVTDLEPAWIAEEIEGLRAAVGGDVPVLGLCFGGQALSAATGGGVERLPRTEYGWLELEVVDPSFPRGPWLHWHDDVLLVPPGAELLARSPAGNAAFRLGRHLGVQFHPEATPEIVADWAQIDERLPAAGITPEGLAADSERHEPAAREAAFRLFDEWWAAR